MERFKVFEAFAGIGAQAAALERLGIDFEIVGISEWHIDAIICYDALHHHDEPFIFPDPATQLEELKQYSFSRDSVRPTTRLEGLKPEMLARLYRAHKRSRNYGSIINLPAETIPQVDLFTYSFPCQDLSTGGKTKGMKKDSGTRSSLLWEVEKILITLAREGRLPKFLVMENVTTIMADSNRGDLNQWLAFLSSLGYYNEPPMILNAIDFGVPQLRRRAFVISYLSDKSLNLTEKIRRQPRQYNFLEYVRDNYRNPIYRAEANAARVNATPSRQEMWRINGQEINADLVVRTITCNMDRTNTAVLFPYQDAYRRLTIREAFLLMGFSETDYERTRNLGFSYRRMNRLIGNSIVVQVLKEMFRVIYEARKEVKAHGKIPVTN